MARVRSILPLLDEREGLTVDELVATQQGGLDGQTGFKLLTMGAEAFLARTVLDLANERGDLDDAVLARFNVLLGIDSG